MILTIKERMGRLFAQHRDKKLRWLMIVGLAGILLIALSEWLPHHTRQTTVTRDSVEVLSAAQVEEALEARIAALIAKVDGVGECHVMITLESGSRFVYAAEQTYNGTAESHAQSEKTLLVETDAGPVGLLVTEVQPTVKGVAVVCSGGADPTVREQVVGLVSAALNISTGRICVAKQK